MTKAGRAATVMHLALDACDTHLLQELAARGECPNIAALLREGAVVDTVAPYGTFVGSSWMTITTGAEVGRHQFHNWAAIDPDTYEIRSTTPRAVEVPPYWEVLSNANRRVAALDVPHSRLPERLNGVVLKEWGCHDRHDGTASHPEELLAELDASVGRHPYGAMDFHAEQFAPCDYTLRAGERRTFDEERAILGAMQRGVDARTAMSLHVLDQGGWDVFTSVLGETHCVGHQLWHVHDQSHPRHDPATRELLGDPVEDIYRRADAWLGAHLSRADDETTIYVQLNHGMGPHYDGDHLLDEIVRRIDEADRGWAPGGRSRLAGRALDALPDRLGRLLDPALAAAVRRRADVAPPQPSAPTGPRADRRAFQLPGNTTVGAVRCNVVGRESRGLLEPGTQLDAFMERLREALLEVVDVDTGHRAVRAVVRSEEVLERSPGDSFADLFVEWERTTLMERVWSPRIGTVAAPYSHWRTGDHVDRGLLIARGPGIRAGRRPTSMSLTDVAPTICAAAGTVLPDADGQAWPDLVDGRGGAISPWRPPVRSLEPTVRPAPAPAADVTGVLARRSLHLADEGRVAATHALARLDHTDAALHHVRLSVEHRLAELERQQQVWSTMALLRVEQVAEQHLVSVITPTYERPDHLQRAIQSVIAQSYRRWEMVVVDDGGDTAKSVVAAIGDERVRAMRLDQNSGPGAARNAALSAARGSIITYLDDDNVLDPLWLKAVAWAFQRHPHRDVLYGARVLDDDRLEGGHGQGGWPWMQFNAFDRAALEQNNFADMGVIAHRAGHPGARFDVTLWECADWDFMLAITEHCAPVELPAVALYYRTHGTDRLTGQHVDHAQIVRDKWAARRAAREGAETAVPS